MLILISIFDTGGKQDGSYLSLTNLKNHLTLWKNLEKKVEYKTFYQYRFSHLLAPTIFINLNLEQIEIIYSLINKYVPNDKLDKYIKFWNSVKHFIGVFSQIAIYKANDNPDFEHFNKLTYFVFKIYPDLNYSNITISSKDNFFDGQFICYGSKELSSEQEQALKTLKNFIKENYATISQKKLSEKNSEKFYDKCPFIISKNKIVLKKPDIHKKNLFMPTGA